MTRGQPPLTQATYAAAHAHSSATLGSSSSGGGGGGSNRLIPSRRVVYSSAKKLSSIMSGYDSNPFVDPVDVNPFQVSLLRLRGEFVWSQTEAGLRDLPRLKPVWSVAGFGPCISWICNRHYYDFCHVRAQSSTYF